MAQSVRERLKLRLLHLSFLLTRPMSLGVRAIVIDADDDVMLVQARLCLGLAFSRRRRRGRARPASSRSSANSRKRRALWSKGRPLLHGLFFNTQSSRRDHVAVYVVRSFRVLGERAPDWEIAEARFFPRSALPEGTTRATRARLAEIFDSAPLSERW